MYKTPIPLSEMNQLFPFNDIREFNQPYFKKAYASEKINLSSNGYVNWIADRVALIGNYLLVLKYILSKIHIIYIDK